MELETEAEIENEGELFGESCLLVFLFIIGLAANGPVLILYFRSKHIRSITDKFLLNLLLADVLSLILLFPSIFSSFLQTQEETHLQSQSQNVSSSFPNISFHWSCAFNNGLVAGLATASVLAALQIAMERYLAVVKPLHYHKFLTTPSILIASLVSGVISISTAIISTFEPNFSIFPHCLQTQGSFVAYEALDETDVELKNNSSSSYINNNNHGHSQGHRHPAASFPGNSSSEGFYYSSPTNGDLIWSLYSLAKVTFLFLIPVFLMLYIYTRIWLEARRQKIKIANQYKPYFLPVPSSHGGSDPSGVKAKGAFLPIIIKFRLMNRLRATRLDRAGRVAVVALVVTILCWSPYFILRALSASQTILTMYGYKPDSNSYGYGWSYSVLPLLAAGLHPLLSPLFYAYRYKRLRTEISKQLSEMISCLCCCCKTHDKIVCGRVDGKNRNSANANSTTASSGNCMMTTNNNSIAPPCIRQTIITMPNPIIIVPQTSQSTPPQPNPNSPEDEASESSINNVLSYGTTTCTCTMITDNEAFEGVEYADAEEEEGEAFVEDIQEISSSKTINGLDDSSGPESHITINVYPDDGPAPENDLEDATPTASTSLPQSSSFSGGIVRVERSVGSFFNYLNVWVSSYSRRWLQHRESVTSTASFITLLSNKYHNKINTVASV